MTPSHSSLLAHIHLPRDILQVVDEACAKRVQNPFAESYERGRRKAPMLDGGGHYDICTWPPIIGVDEMRELGYPLGKE